MRRKIAKRWRREAIRRGAVITNEKPVFSKKELREYGLKDKDAWFSFIGEYNGWKWMIAGYDELDAYRLFVRSMDEMKMEDIMS